MNKTSSILDTNERKSQGRNLKDSNLSFIAKMHQILQDKTCNDCIKWNPDGSSFQILNVLEFSNKVLSKYFKHTNYSSYVRQVKALHLLQIVLTPKFTKLNMYGFHKIRSDNAEIHFYHEKFKMNGSELHKIKRLKLSKNLSEDEEDEHFIEKYSGARTTRRQVAENKELSGFKNQIEELNQKFKGFEDATNELKDSIERQNNQVKDLLSEMIQIRLDGEKKFQALFKQVFNRQQISVRESDQIHLNEDDGKPKLETNKIGLDRPLSDMGKHKNTRQPINTNFPKITKSNENLEWNPNDFADNGIQSKDLTPSNTSVQNSLNKLNASHPSLYNHFEVQSTAHHRSNEGSKVEEHSYLAHSFPGNPNEMQETNWESQSNVAISDPYRNSENPNGSRPYKKIQKVSFRAGNKNVEDSLARSQPYY